MLTAAKRTRVEALESLLPFFRLHADEALIATVVRETADLDDEAFFAGCDGALRAGRHEGNVIAELRRFARAARPA